MLLARLVGNILTTSSAAQIGVDLGADDSDGILSTCCSFPHPGDVSREISPFTLQALARPRIASCRNTRSRIAMAPASTLTNEPHRRSFFFFQSGLLPRSATLDGLKVLKTTHFNLFKSVAISARIRRCSHLGPAVISYLFG